MKTLGIAALVVAGVLASSAAPAAAQARVAAIALPAQSELVRQYLRAMQSAHYGDAYQRLNANARAYYRNTRNFASVYIADGYRLTAFKLVGSRANDSFGRVFFARESARFRDHAHDTELHVTATVPIGVVAERGGWRIKDPGHPWRAFAAGAEADANGVHVRVKKVSFFAHRIETVVSFINTGPTFVTILAYGKSILHDSGGRPYRLIETHDWSLTDRTLFEGLRLAPDAQYTGNLAFACAQLDNSARTFALRIAPLLADGTDMPFTIDVTAITALDSMSPAK